jgi:hypothetical protein
MTIIHPYNNISSEGASNKMDEKLSPIHPGEILMEEFLKP